MPTDQTPGSKDGQNTDQTGEDSSLDVNAIVNSAVTAQLKRALSPQNFAKLIAPVLEAAVKPLGEQIAELKAAPAPAATGTPPSDANKPNPELTAVKQQLQEMKDQLAKERDRAAAAETMARDDATFGALKSRLAAAKVRPEMVESLAKVLFYADRRVEFDENGKPLMRVRVSPGKGLAEEDQLLTLEDGVKAFVKSKEAEPWLPAPGGPPTAPGQQRRSPGVGGHPPTHQGPPANEAEANARTMEQLAALNLPLP